MKKLWDSIAHKFEFIFIIMIIILIIIATLINA